MKKTLFTALMTGVTAFTLCSLFSVPALASCPVKTNAPCQKKCDKPVPSMECDKSMSPEEHAKMREAKKAEFEARLQLTETQKAQLEKIKADEKKALAPYKAKIEKEQAKIDALFEKEKAVRMETMKKFEATLTAEQKAELTKIKEEMKAEMEKMAPKGPKFMGPHHPKFGQKPMCPPQCDCGCHNPEAKKPEPADCGCPCHQEPLKNN